jgi:large subunit ribosomal protein L1
MGKIRVKTFGNEEQELKEKEEAVRKKQAKIEAAKSSSAEKKVETDSNEPVKTEEHKEPVKKKQDTTSKKIFHSAKYQSLSGAYDKLKIYTLSEGLDLLPNLQRKTTDETVELHINTTSTGISGNVTLPHGTGKKTKVAIATEALIAEIEKGKIDFDILLAEPSMMVKLAKVAKILGPRGLMPNPKNGTITPTPEVVAKKYEAGQVNFKTEAKSPIIHLVVGKMSFGKIKLTENIEEMLKAVKKTNIINVTLKSTMSPGIKLKI